MTTNLSTGTRHYSLFALANQAVFDAEQVRLKAYRKAERDPSRQNIREFMEADKAFLSAVSARDQVKLMQKHNRGTVDSTNDTLRGSLSDAGFGDGGIF